MHTQALTYQSNTAELFQHFAHLPYATLLDSCRHAQQQGRYDIMVADPIKLIAQDDADVFTAIQAALDEFNITPTHTDFPFTIGAVGYLTYDIGRQLESIPNRAVDDIALPKSSMGIYDWSIIVDHHLKKTTLIHLLPKNNPRTQFIFDCLNASPPTEQPFSIEKPFQSNMTRDFYSTAFNTIKKHISAGDCYQVNLAQRFSAEFSGSAWQAYQLLRTNNPAPFAAFMRLPKAAILCMSPERFLKVTDRIVETKPIKGTAPRHADPEKDTAFAEQLCQSEKDRAENIMIVDLLRNDLSRTCIAGSVQVPQLCTLESFSNVHHLVSTIIGKLADKNSALDLLQHCFPGGSITGAPKIAAMKIIESLEPHRRSLYCGSIFYVDVNGSMDSNIVIRTVIADQNKMHCYAGGGIVFDSECEAEYQETRVKVDRIMQAL